MRAQSLTCECHAVWRSGLWDPSSGATFELRVPAGMTCAPASRPRCRCQACWDTFQEQVQQASGGGSSSGGGGAGSSRAAGPPLHNVRHSFQHVGPRMTRHNDYYGTRGDSSDSGDPANPWGRPTNGGASLQRALRRLGERYGIREWF